MTVVVLLSACSGTEPIVSAGQVAVKLNPAFLPGGNEPRYTSVITAGNRYDVNDKGYELKKILIVPEGKLGWDGTRNLLPGPYPNLAEGDITIFRDMTVITTGWIAVHSTGDGTYQALQPGRHAVPLEEVIRIPTGSLRYRTLASELLPDENACESFKCETSITRASVSGSQVEATVDVDVLFHFDTTDPQALWKLQDLEVAVQNFVGSTLRGSRAASSPFTIEQLKTQAGREALQEAYLQPLKASTAATPIIVDQVLVRSITFGDEAWRQAQLQREQELAVEQNQAALLQEQQKNLAAENKLKAERAAFAREQALLDADNRVQVAQKLLTAYSTSDWRILWVLMYGEQVPPFMNADGNLSQQPELLRP